MPKPPPKHVTDFMSAFNVDADELWEVRPGTGTYAIKHAALERVAAEQGISFDPPMMLEFHAADKIAVICVTGRKGDRADWSIGEAAPYNNKNTYPFAMAEKRARDRVTLKLLNAHGTVYSEEEADEFKASRPNPHVTRPDDLVPTVEYDDNGHPVDNIPLGDDRITQMPKAKAKNEYAAMQSELLATKTPADLERWGAANKNRVATLPRDWQDIMRGQYTDHMADLRSQQKEVA
jgi:hypothetical protein